MDDLRKSADAMLRHHNEIHDLGNTCQFAADLKGALDVDAMADAMWSDPEWAEHAAKVIVDSWPPSARAAMAKALGTGQIIVPADIDEDRLKQPFLGGNYLQLYNLRDSRWLTPEEAVQEILTTYRGTV